MEYDLIIIGSGPGGYIGAVKAAQLGMKVLVVEKSQLGGTCLNRGCIPTKSLLHSSSLYKESLKLDLFGVNAENISFNYRKIHERKENVVNQLRDGINKLFKANKIDLIYGLAKIQKHNLVKIATADGDINIKGQRIIIATGSKPASIPIEGINLPNVFNSDMLLNSVDKLYKKLTIIGGGVIGLEFATIYNNLGADVTIIESMDRIIPQMDKEISRTLAMSLKKKGINIITLASVLEIEKKDEDLICHYMDKGQKHNIISEAVLVATGRVANTDKLFDDNLNIEMDGKSIRVDENFQTSIPNIYAIGDAIKGMQLAHLASAQAINCVDHIINNKPLINLNVIPSCIYTNPEIASVGISQEEAKLKGIQVKVGKFPILANSKALIADDERGYIKVIFDSQTDKIIGADIICSRATDMIGELGLGIANGLTIKEMQSIIRPHPTYEESILDAINNIK